LGIVALLLVVGASLAFATEISRSEYKEKVEPICEANATANKRILAGARQEVKEGKLMTAAAKFTKAAQALGKTHRELNAVPRPAADAPRLEKWLSYVKTEVGLLRDVAKALKEGKPNKARAFVARLTVNANLANSQIVIFDLNHCLFKPAQYT